MDVFEKSTTVDPEVRAHVYSLVSAVGGNSNINDGQYVLGDDALACLKDIGRWIRLYDDKTNRHDVKRCLAEANLVKGDLLEILAQWPETQQTSVLRSKIAIQCLDLLKELTWPTALENPDQATVNYHRHLPFLQLAQVGYKRAILQHETAQILRTVIRIIIPIISTPKEEKTSRDWQVLNVSLYFLRNVAIISQPQKLPSQGDENEVSRSATINAFHEQDVLQLILTIASSIAEEYPQQDVVIMELLFQLLKGIDPADLFKEKNEVDNDRIKAFRALVSKEKAMVASYQKNAPSRHNRFGSMIWVKRPDQKLTTLSGQKVIFDQSRTMDVMDKSKAWNKPKPRFRNKEVLDETNDFAATVHLEDDSTRRVLRDFVQDFLDSSFNPLFNSLRRAISSEADRAKAYNARQYYYLMGWFLQAERARQALIKQNKSGQTATAQSPEEDSPFAYIAAVMTQENFVLLNRKMQQSLDDKEWSDLHACMHAFTEILHTVAAMSESSSEDDQEIAENIQSRIFYEETTHDLVIAILRNYKEQGFAYLDSSTELAHVFMRMLERYSKQNVGLQIRSKQRARKKRKDAARARGEDDQADNSEGEDEAEAHRTSSERKFDFGRLAAKFMTESCINTFVRFTQYYRDFDEEQLKRSHRFFYRCAFKMERIILLFRVDILHLFNRMIKGSESLPRDARFFKDWEELVRQIFRRCIKKLEERRELMVEMLFTKMPQTLFYLEHGHDLVVEKRPPRPPAELIIKSGMTKEEEIGVAISVLVNQGKLDDIAWIKRVLGEAAEERNAWEDQQAAQASVENPPDAEVLDTAENREDSGEGRSEEPLQDPLDDQTPTVPSIVVKPESPERKTALYKDKFLRLLLNLLRFERLGANNDPDATWLIPSTLNSTELRSFLELIRKLEFDLPTFEEGVTPESLLRNKSAAGLHARADRGSASREASRANSRANSVSRDDSDDDGVGLSEIEELDERYAPGGPTAHPASDRPAKTMRKRRLRRAVDEMDEEESKRRAEERRKREKEKDAKIKSTLRVTDSDDEDDSVGDAEFFRLEEKRREKMKGVIRNELLKVAAVDEEERAKAKDGGKKGKERGRKRKSDGGESVMKKGGRVKKRKTMIEDDDDDDDEEGEGEGEGDGDVEMSDASSSSPRAEQSDGDEEGEAEVGDVDDTPLSSQPTGGDAGEASSGTADKKSNDEAHDDEDDDDDDDVVVVKQSLRRAAARGPFIIDSDSESE